MVRVIALSNPRLAQAFVDYMATRDVQLECRASGSEVELWLEQQTQLEQVQHELQQFLLEPYHPRYQAASWQSGSTTSGLQYSATPGRQILRHTAQPLTLGITVLCIVVYLLMQMLGEGEVMSWLSYPVDSSQYVQFWRWVSPALLHFSLMHILFNLVLWWYLGSQVEQHLGTGKLLVITLVSAVFSGWGQSLFSGANFGGLSGVVYALTGYVWLVAERVPQRGLTLPRGMIVLSVFWLVAGYFDIFGLSLANAAHGVGLLIGLIMALMDTHQRRPRS